MNANAWYINKKIILIGSKGKTMGVLNLVQLLSVNYFVLAALLCFDNLEQWYSWFSFAFPFFHTYWCFKFKQRISGIIFSLPVYHFPCYCFNYLFKIGLILIANLSNINQVFIYIITLFAINHVISVFMKFRQVR